MSTAQDNPLPVPDMSAFFSREKANSGVLLRLRTLTGEPTGAWLRVVGVDSDIFRLEKVASQRRVVEIMKAFSTESKDQELLAELDGKRKEALEEEERRLSASLVSEWNLPNPFSVEAVMRLFKEAPHIYSAVDELAFKRERFFGLVLSNSPNTQSQSSDLTESPKEPEHAPETT
jgi:hypothetical protein